MTIKPARIKYLSNPVLLSEIAKSKNSFCQYLEPQHAEYDMTIDAIGSTDPAEAVLMDLNLPSGTIVRVYTFEHIPLDPNREVKPREKNKTHAKVSFNPFIHYERTADGWSIVGKSHWKGGLTQGYFCADHGRISNNLAIALMKLVERIGTKGNWRGYSYNDEMQSAALVQLCQVALQFDESRTSNPFAYYTTVVTNVFTRVFNDEKKNQSIRDDLLIQAGQSPSSTRQAEHEMAMMGLKEPAPLAKKRGRPPKNGPKATIDHSKKLVQKPETFDPTTPRRGRPPKWLVEERNRMAVAEERGRHEVGSRHGSRTIIAEAPRTNPRYRMVTVRCDCGRTADMRPKDMAKAPMCASCAQKKRNQLK